ncbi:18622_t:CDS:2, partial [Gigaspora margarita]
YDFDIELSSVIDIILNENDENFVDEKLYLEVVRHIIKFIKKEDGYRWIYKDKNSKRIHSEFNQKIIVNLSIPIPTLGFFTALFYKFSRNNFSAILVDATFGTNKIGWEFYALMGVIDRTGFPLSYLLIATEKNQNTIGILSQ